MDGQRRAIGEGDYQTIYRNPAVICGRRARTGQRQWVTDDPLIQGLKCYAKEMDGGYNLVFRKRTKNEGFCKISVNNYVNHVVMSQIGSMQIMRVNSCPWVEP